YKMPWVTNYDYGTWDAQTWWGEPKVKKEKGKGKGRGKGKDTAVEKTAKGKKKEEQTEPGLKEENSKLKQAIRLLMEKVETKEPISEEVQELVQEDPRELIRQKQKALNEERKLLNRSEKLQETIREKEEKFAAWDQYIRGGLQMEAQRVQEEIAELKETMKKEEKVEKEEMDLDVDKDPEGLKAEIAQLKHGMQQMMSYTAQMESKHQQFLEQMQMQMATLVNAATGARMSQGFDFPSPEQRVHPRVHGLAMSEEPEPKRERTRSPKTRMSEPAETAEGSFNEFVQKEVERMPEMFRLEVLRNLESAPDLYATPEAFRKMAVMVDKEMQMTPVPEGGEMKVLREMSKSDALKPFGKSPKKKDREGPYMLPLTDAKGSSSMSRRNSKEEGRVLDQLSD
ncbi:unnamed protein product, partial [Durusdinium trenchii]